MEAITYSLKQSNSNTKEYYKKVTQLAFDIINKANKLLEPIISTSFESPFILSTKTINERILELLLLGIYLRRSSFKSLGSLVGQKIDSVLDKLAKTSDYQYQLKSLRLWVAFLETQPPKERTCFWQLIDGAVAEFAKNAEEVLSFYTKNVEKYLTTIYPLRSNRADAYFCGSPEIEYHINMVGAEILNGILQKQFLATKDKVVVLPGCMRKSPQKCAAREALLGLECQHCNSNCQISLVTKIGLQYGFEVVFVNHQSSLATHVTNLKKLNLDKDLGVVGVACALSLIEGGYMLMEQGIPAQCVVLDYCGCVNHWHDQGITTSIDIDRLLEILKVI